MTAFIRTRSIVVILGVLFLLVSGCYYGRGLTYTEGGTLMGALYGAGLGAAIGSATGHAGEGAGIGALAGSLIGGAIGYGMEGPYRNGYYNDPYYNDRGYRDPYYTDRYSGRNYDPYYGHPDYRGNRGGPPGRDPYYRQDPSYDMGGYDPIPYENNQDDSYDSADTGAPVYSEEYYQEQNRRVMSPGYTAQ